MDNEQKFEYKIIKLKGIVASKTLNKAAGDRGWQLVTIIPTDDGYYYHFMREIYQLAYLNEGEVIEDDEWPN